MISFPAIDESLRCLSNIYLQCAKSDAALSLDKHIIAGIIHQSKRYKELKIPLSVISFDMRLLFLVTAYFPESRQSKKIFNLLTTMLHNIKKVISNLNISINYRTLLYIEHDGITRLAEILSNCLDMAKNDTEDDEKIPSDNSENIR